MPGLALALMNSGGQRFRHEREPVEQRVSLSSAHLAATVIVQTIGRERRSTRA
jgi:hypothetical protein